MTAVVTTINEPTKAIEKLYDHFGENIIIVGDKKTPSDWNYQNCTYIPVDDTPPHNHYARKNIGYIQAMIMGTDCIMDGDDDNIPNEKFKIRDIECDAVIAKDKGWFNAYSYFSSEKIWPRGFDLSQINIPQQTLIHFGKIKSSIQQGLSDISPDVDAIWRLTNNSIITFKTIRSIYLDKFVWCPINSQCTWWFKKAFPLLYLPQYASFRMTDILRGFVAQRCLWELGEGVTFHSPSEVYQERNPHNLMNDFKDEISGYLNNGRIVSALTELELGGNIFDNLFDCYNAIIELGVLPKLELISLNKWVKDVKENAQRTLR